MPKTRDMLGRGVATMMVDIICLLACVFRTSHLPNASQTKEHFQVADSYQISETLRRPCPTKIENDSQRKFGRQGIFCQRAKVVVSRSSGTIRSMVQEK